MYYYPSRLSGTLTLETCKQYRLKKEQEKELADLNPRNIIGDEGEVTDADDLSSTTTYTAHGASAHAFHW